MAEKRECFRHRRGAELGQPETETVDVRKERGDYKLQMWQRLCLMTVSYTVLKCKWYRDNSGGYRQFPFISEKNATLPS